MRFIAAAMVFFFHALYEGFFASPQSTSVYKSLFYQGGWAGVGFFFVLSGFVLTWSTRADDTAPAFLRRRLFKIYPLHLLTLAAAAALMVWVAGAPVDGGRALMHLLLIQSWSPDVMIRAGFNGVAWSLSCELLFYALFPILIRIINRIRPERLWASAGVVVAAVLVVPFISRLLPNQEEFPGMGITAADLWFVYQFPPTRLLDFVFGIILARVVMERRRLPLSFGGSVALAVAAYAVGPLFPSSFHLVAVMIVPLGLVVASAAADETAGRRNWLSSRVMIWLGEVSFAFYITHQIVQSYGHRFLGMGKSWDTPQAIGVIALLFGVTLLVSWLAFTLVERPVMRRFGRSRRRFTAPSERTVSPVPAARTESPAEERQPSVL